MKYLTIDPSGTGTTGLFFVDRQTQQEEFTQYQSTNWQDHLKFLIDYIQVKQPTQVIYENTNYIHKQTKDGLSLFKLFGGIESFKYLFPSIQRVDSISVIPVKSFYKKLYAGQEQIPHLIYKKGRDG